MAPMRSLRSMVVLLAMATCIAEEDQSDVAQMDDAAFALLGEPMEFEDLEGETCKAQYTTARSSANLCLKASHETLAAMNYGAEQTATHENVTLTLELVGAQVCQCVEVYKSEVAVCMAGENTEALVAIQVDIAKLENDCDVAKGMSTALTMFMVLMLVPCFVCCACWCLICYCCCSGDSGKKKTRDINLLEEGSDSDS